MLSIVCVVSVIVRVVGVNFQMTIVFLRGYFAVDQGSRWPPLVSISLENSLMPDKTLEETL